MLNHNQHKRSGAGAGGLCSCPHCGYETRHQQGFPCDQRRCPSCGAMLVRKESSLEVKQSNSIPSINQTLCKGCARCVSRCPAEAIVMQDGKASIDATLCLGCRRCESACPVQAIG